MQLYKTSDNMGPTMDRHVKEITGGLYSIKKERTQKKTIVNFFFFPSPLTTKPTPRRKMKSPEPRNIRSPFSHRRPPQRSFLFPHLLLGGVPWLEPRARPAPSRLRGGGVAGGPGVRQSCAQIRGDRKLRRLRRHRDGYLAS